MKQYMVIETFFMALGLVACQGQSTTAAPTTPLPTTVPLQAVESALTCVPSHWRRLIQEAVDIRAGQKTSAYQFRVVRMVEAVNFLKYIIQSCNADFS